MLHVLRRYVLVYTRQTHVKGFASVAPPSEQLDKFRASFSQHEIEVRREAAASARGIIKLNIGGVEHTTSLATLTAVPGTYFTALLCGDLNQALTSSGELFVDRQGKYFEHILQYLRSERYDHAFRVPESLPRDALAALATEAKFYNFVTLHQSLREALRKPPLVFQHKFLEKDVYTSWEEHGKQIQDLLRHGWELHDTSMSASNGNVHGLTRLILRSDHDRARNIT